MVKLVKCEDCNKKVSINADTCPNCGSPVQKQLSVQNQKTTLLNNNKPQKTPIIIGWVVSFITLLISPIAGLISFAAAIALIHSVKEKIDSKFYISNSHTTIISNTIIFSAFFLSIILAMDSSTEIDPINPTQSVTDSNPNIEAVNQPENIVKDYSHIAIPYTEKSYPKLYAAWGKEWVDDINNMMPLVVQRVAANPKCDAPSIADLSDNRSTVRQEAAFFVDCENGERFYVNQNELTDTTQLEAESDMLSGKPSDYIESCRDMVKAQLNYPSSFDEELGTNSFKGSSGNMVVEISFTAQNALGADLPQAARCVFGTNGKNEAVITNR